MHDVLLGTCRDFVAAIFAECCQDARAGTSAAATNWICRARPEGSVEGEAADPTHRSDPAKV
eukprot:4030293-Alexandrium_andersonii.AAC.1